MRTVVILGAYAVLVVAVVALTRRAGRVLNSHVPVPQQATWRDDCECQLTQDANGWHYDQCLPCARRNHVAACKRAVHNGLIDARADEASARLDPAAWEAWGAMEAGSER